MKMYKALILGVSLSSGILVLLVSLLLFSAHGVNGRSAALLWPGMKEQDITKRLGAPGILNGVNLDSGVYELTWKNAPEELSIVFSLDNHQMLSGIVFRQLSELESEQIPLGPKMEFVDRIRLLIGF